MTERQGARMSKINNVGLDQYGDEPFEQQQFGTAGGEGVNARQSLLSHAVLTRFAPVATITINNIVQCVLHT